MAGVQYKIECKMCGRNASLEYDSNKFTHWIQCGFCGYQYENWYLIDRKHEKKTGEKIYKLTKAGKWIHRFRERIGHGAYCITEIKGRGCFGAAPYPLTQKHIEDLSRYLERPEIDQGRSYLLSFDPMTKELTAVIGKIPEGDPFGD